MYDVGVGSKQSRFGWGCYRASALIVTHRLHMRQVIQSRSMGARRGKLTGSFVGLSSLPVNESRSFRCNACLDQPSPWYEVNEHSRFLPPVPSKKGGGLNKDVKSA